MIMGMRVPQVDAVKLDGLSGRAGRSVSSNQGFFVDVLSARHAVSDSADGQVVSADRHRAQGGHRQSNDRPDTDSKPRASSNPGSSDRRSTTAESGRRQGNVEADDNKVQRATVDSPDVGAGVGDEEGSNPDESPTEDVVLFLSELATATGMMDSSARAPANPALNGMSTADGGMVDPEAQQAMGQRGGQSGAEAQAGDGRSMAGQGGSGQPGNVRLDELAGFRLVEGALRVEMREGASARPVDAATLPGGSQPASVLLERVGTDAGASRMELLRQMDDAQDQANVARLGRALNSGIAQRGGSVTLRLNPPEMGLVRVSLQVTDTTVTARFAAQTPEARQMLERSVEQLRASLERHGLHVERLVVREMPPSQGQEGAGQFGDESRFAGDGRSRNRYTGQHRRDGLNAESEPTAEFATSLADRINAEP
ncbi:MAG: flagellar hook-length control protein FliK [Phycisphaeraceae bacterium]|nr:flagellar hook-length control protein FliK [Phycisphaeraceae bacterium]